MHMEQGKADCVWKVNQSSTNESLLLASTTNATTTTTATTHPSTTTNTTTMMRMRLLPQDDDASPSPRVSLKRPASQVSPRTDVMRLMRHNEASDNHNGDDDDDSVRMEATTTPTATKTTTTATTTPLHNVEMTEMTTQTNSTKGPGPAGTTITTTAHKCHRGEEDGIGLLAEGGKWTEIRHLSCRVHPVLERGTIVRPDYDRWTRWKVLFTMKDPSSFHSSATTLDLDVATATTTTTPTRRWFDAEFAPPRGFRRVPCLVGGPWNSTTSSFKSSTTRGRHSSVHGRKPSQLLSPTQCEAMRRWHKELNTDPTTLVWTDSETGYLVDVPVTADGCLLNLKVFQGKLCFLGYRQHANGKVGLVEQLQLVRKRFDILAAIDGVPVEDQTEAVVQTLLSRSHDNPTWQFRFRPFDQPIQRPPETVTDYSTPWTQVDLQIALEDTAMEVDEVEDAASPSKESQGFFNNDDDDPVNDSSDEESESARDKTSVLLHVDNDDDDGESSKGDDDSEFILNDEEDAKSEDDDDVNLDMGEGNTREQPKPKATTTKRPTKAVVQARNPSAPAGHATAVYPAQPNALVQPMWPHGGLSTLPMEGPLAPAAAAARPLLPEDYMAVVPVLSGGLHLRVWEMHGKLVFYGFNPVPDAAEHPAARRFRSMGDLFVEIDGRNVEFVDAQTALQVLRDNQGRQRRIFKMRHNWRAQY